MNLTKLLKSAEKFAIDNSPAILTGVGAVGTVATTYLTAVGTFKAAKLIEEEQQRRNLHEIRPAGMSPEFGTREKIFHVWKCYVPATSALTLSVTAIIMANHVNARRMAALAAAYSIADGRFSDYKEKVAEKLGVKKEQAVREELKQQRIDNQPPAPSQLIIATGEVLCFDQYTGRYFHSTMEKLKRAENDINYEILNSGYACLSDLYERVGLKPTSISEEMGWRSPQKLELEISTQLTPDGKPCLAFDIDATPIRNYDRCHAE